MNKRKINLLENKSLLFYFYILNILSRGQYIAVLLSELQNLQSKSVQYKLLSFTINILDSKHNFDSQIFDLFLYECI